MKAQDSSDEDKIEKEVAYLAKNFHKFLKFKKGGKSIKKAKFSNFKKDKKDLLHLNQSHVMSAKRLACEERMPHLFDGKG